MPRLTDYTGDAALGLGSNPQIPVTTTGTNDVINQTGRDLLLLNYENNLKLFNQKVQDRDTLYNLLATGQGSTGAIRDEDRKIYNDAKADANNTFLELAKSGGVNNPAAMKKYKEKVDYLNQVATQAQARYKLMGDDEKAIASETRPEIRKDMQKNVDDWKPNFWGNYTPYQKAYDYDVFNMRKKYLNGALQGETNTPTATTDVTKVVNKDGKVTTTNVQKTAPLKGKQPLTGNTVMENGLPYSVQKGGRVDFGKIMNNVVSDYQENKDFGAEDQRALLKGIEQLPVAQQQEYLGNLLKKAQQYNNENDLKPDENGNYPDGAINIDRLRTQFVPRDPNNLKAGYHVALSAPELTALDALASLDTYKQPDTKVLDKDAAKLLETERHNKATEGIGWAKANAYLKKTNAQLSKMKNEEERSNELNGYYIRNITQQPSLIKGEGNNNYSLAPVQAQNSLPLFTFSNGKPSLLVPIDAKYDATSKTWKGGHYDQQYVMNDRPVPLSKINEIYVNFKNKTGWTGGIDEFLKQAIENKKFNVVLKGKNGVTDEKLSTAAQQAIQNMNTKKGQTGVFDDSEDNEPFYQSTEQTNSSSNSETTPQ